MDGLLDQPAVVILAAAAASILLLVEVALPTVGLAGGAGIAAGALGVWAIDRIGEDWWPLLGIVAAVALWGGLLAMRRSSSTGHLVALVLFLAGALGYAGITRDWPAVVTAVAAGGVLAVAFPRIATASNRLLGGKPAVGVESLIGDTAAVVAWEGTHGQVMVAGTRWNATGPDDLHEGDIVEILAASGLLLTVGSAHG
jgi:membrane-bound ClpP family serine protease